MEKQNDFQRFFFEVSLDESPEEEDCYIINAELYIRFEHRRQQYVAYVYNEADFPIDMYYEGSGAPAEA